MSFSKNAMATMVLQTSSGFFGGTHIVISFRWEMLVIVS